MKMKILLAFEMLGTNNSATQHHILVCVKKSQRFLPVAHPVSVFVYLSYLGPNRHQILYRIRIHYLNNKYFGSNLCEFTTPMCKER
jgi:hypothetical protein